MAETFRNPFIIMAICAMINLTASLSPYYIDKTRRKDVYAYYMFAAVPGMILALVCWIFLFFQRFSFPGQVCSGVYLADDDYDKDPKIEAKYTVDMGLFIKFTFILFICLITWVCCGICMYAGGHLAEYMRW